MIWCLDGCLGKLILRLDQLNIYEKPNPACYLIKKRFSDSRFGTQNLVLKIPNFPELDDAFSNICFRLLLRAVHILHMQGRRGGGGGGGKPNTDIR